MNERDEFEAWFKFCYGPRPVGNIETLQDEAREIQEKIDMIHIKIDRINDYNMKHSVALTAWHSCKNKTDQR